MAKGKNSARTIDSQATVGKAGHSRRDDVAPGRSGSRAAPRSAALQPMGLPLPYKLSLAALCLLLLLSPIFLSSFWEAGLDLEAGTAYVPQMLFLSVTACACLILALWPAPPHAAGEAKQHFSPISLLLGAFFLWCALSIANSVYLHDSLLEITRIGACIAWFFAARSLLIAYSERAVPWRQVSLVGAIAVTGIIVAVPAIGNFLQSHDPRQFSYFYNPNLFANYCALALPLALSWPVLVNRVVSRGRTESNAESTAGDIRWPVVWLALIPTPFILLGLALTSSKGGILAMLAGLIVFAVAVWHARRRRLGALIATHRVAVIIAVLLVVVAGGFVFKRTVLPRLQEASGLSDNSTLFRSYTWRGTLHMAQARPVLGWGPGSYPSAFPQFAITGYTRTAHHVWLQLAAESGFPAMLLLLAVCLTAGVRGVRALRGRDWPIAAGGLGAVAAFVVHGLTDAGWSITSIALLLCVALALLDSNEVPGASSEVEMALPEDAAPRSNLRWPWLGLALLFALAAAGTERAVNAEDFRADARRLASGGDYSGAVDKSQAAAQADALGGRIWSNLGQAQEAARQDATAAYRKAIAVQPTYSRHYINLARYLVKGDAGQANAHRQEARRLFDRAVALNPNDSATRLERGQWLLAQHDPAGWQDYEYVAKLATQPYGLYPATPQFVNLDFARAYVKLAERLLQSGAAADKARAREYVEQGLKDIATEHDYQGQQEEMAKALGTDQFAPAKDLDSLEASLKNLKERLH